MAFSSLILKYVAARNSLSVCVDDEKNSLLHVLCRTGKQSCLKALLAARYFESKALMQHNMQGESPLHVSVLAGQKASLDQLLAHTASTKDVPLAFGVRSQWLAAAVLDTVGSLDVNVGKDAQRENGEQELDSRGREAVRQSQYFGDNCLHLAGAVSEGSEMLDRLLKALEDSNSPREIQRFNASGWTCLHIGCI